MTRRRIAHGFALGLGLLAMGTTQAGKPGLRLSIDPCLAMESTTLRRLAILEVKGLSLESSDERAAPFVGKIEVGCDGDRAHLRYTDLGTGQGVERAITLDTVPPSARPRLLALAIAELVSAARIETAIFPERSSSPALPAAPAAATPARASSSAQPSAPALAPVAAVGRSRRPYRFLVLGSVAGYFGRSGLLAGATLRGAADHRRGLAWAIELEALHGRQVGVLGQVSLDTLSVGAAIGYAHALGRVSLRALAGARAGAARLGGQPASEAVTGSSLWGPYVGPIAQLGVTVAATRRLVVELIAEAGYIAVRVEGRADRDLIAEVGGASLGLKLGLGMFP